jgi:hypothetical protein
MELRGLSMNFLCQVTVNDLYIPTIGLPILLQENMRFWEYINRSETHDVEIGTQATQFLFWEYTLLVGGSGYSIV